MPPCAVTMTTQSASRRAVERDRVSSCSGSSRHVRVGVGDLGALGAKQLDQLQRRRLAQVAHVLLVGDAHEVHPAAAHGALRSVQRARDLLEAEVRHVLVDLPGELDELRVEVVLARLPGEVERIDGRQWPPSPGPGLKRMKPNGFVPAASTTSQTSRFMRSHNCASSLTRAMLTERKMFSSSFTSSAASGDDTGTSVSIARLVEGEARSVQRPSRPDHLRGVLRRPIGRGPDRRARG